MNRPRILLKSFSINLRELSVRADELIGSKHCINDAWSFDWFSELSLINSFRFRMSVMSLTEENERIRRLFWVWLMTSRRSGFKQVSQSSNSGSRIGNRLSGIEAFDIPPFMRNPNFNTHWNVRGKVSKPGQVRRSFRNWLEEKILNSEGHWRFSPGRFRDEQAFYSFEL